MSYNQECVNIMTILYWLGQFYSSWPIQAHLSAHTHNYKMSLYTWKWCTGTWPKRIPAESDRESPWGIWAVEPSEMTCSRLSRLLDPQNNRSRSSFTLPLSHLNPSPIGECNIRPKSVSQFGASIRKTQGLFEPVSALLGPKLHLISAYKEPEKNSAKMQRWKESRHMKWNRGHLLYNPRGSKSGWVT